MSEYICPAAPEVTHCYNAKAVRELIRQARMDALEEAAKEIREAAKSSPYALGRTAVFQRGLSDGYEAAAQVVKNLKEKTP